MLLQNQLPLKPPRRYKGVKGLDEARIVLLDAAPPWLKTSSRPRGAKAAGLRYEKQVYKMLGRLPTRFRLLQQPIFRIEAEQRQFIIPDALIFSKNDFTIVEIKLRHTSDAYFQLTHKYAPVLHHYYGMRPKVIEICKFFDPSTRFPTDVERVGSLADFLDSYDAPASFPVKVYDERYGI